MPDPCRQPRLQEAAYKTIARLINDPDRRNPVWHLIRKSPATRQGLRDVLQKFKAAGFPLEESEVLQHALLDTGTLTPWLVHNILQLQETQERFENLETTVDLISKSFSAFIKDVSEALPKHRRASYVSILSPIHDRLDRLSATLQRHNDIRCNKDKDELQPASKTGGTPGCPDADDRYKALTERIQDLEEMAKEHGNRLNPPQTATAPEESGVAGTQELERAMQANQLTFAALSDASESSTCTVTPASVSWTEQIVNLN